VPEVFSTFNCKGYLRVNKMIKPEHDEFSILNQVFDFYKEQKEFCSTCENGGWVQVYSEHPPAFEVCPDCYNPNDLPSP